MVNHETTLSVNHNWINSYNIEHLIRSLFEDLSLAEEAIADCRTTMDEVEFHEACQRMLRSNCSFDFLDVHCMLSLALWSAVRTLRSHLLDMNVKSLLEWDHEIFRNSPVPCYLSHDLPIDRERRKQWACNDLKRCKTALDLLESRWPIDDDIYGMSQQSQIAFDLGLRDNTSKISSHRHALKTDVSSFTELLPRLGLLSP